ncbi:MAG: Protein kinase domain, partial [Deltaproteobacteria bacterium]|nr:Protein kinase domain [Deltaproteobacteria bacterium]
MIRGYTIEEFLGSGSFGAVARVRKHGLDYAMKAFLPGKDDDEFRLEADILSQLDHPGIPAFVQT